MTSPSKPDNIECPECGCRFTNIVQDVPTQAARGETNSVGTWYFHRFVEGRKMAEDVVVERAKTLDEAIAVAARICAKRPMTVLIHAAAPAAATEPSDDYQKGFADGAGIYRANAAKAIKESVAAVDPIKLVVTRNGKELTDQHRGVMEFIEQATIPERTAAAAPEGLTDEQTQPFYDLAWKHNAQAHQGYAGDELEAISFVPSDFDAFCAELTASDDAKAAELTDSQIIELADQHDAMQFHYSPSKVVAFARAAIAASTKDKK